MNPSRKSLYTFIPVAVVTLVVLWFFRPLFHGYVMSVWAEPLGTLLITAAVLLAAYAFSQYGLAHIRAARHGRRPAINPLKLNLPLALAVLLVVGSLFYKGAARDLSLAQAYRTYDFKPVSALPADDQPRLVPLAVAQRFGADSLQRSTERAYKWYPQYWDGRFSWVAGLTPNSELRQWFDQASGLQVVDATTAQRSTKVVDQKFKLSEGVQLTDNLRWQLYKRRYFVNLPEVYHAQVGGKVYAVAPIVAYQGFLIRHPVLAGAFVVSADGAIEELTVAQAKSHPAVKAAGRLYPESLTRFAHESYALKGGVFNKWFRHVDQTEISDPPGETNAQPYLLATKGGLNWLSAADPWGQSFGIYKIFITDALTGEHRLYSVDKDSSLTGAAQAIGYVKSARPQYNWQVQDSAESSSTSGNIIAIEPRPVFVSDQLYWMVSVTTTEAKGINETCFVNAKDNAVTCATKDGEVKSFIATGSTKPADAPATTGPAQPAAPAQPTSRERIDKLESTLRQALQELEALKAAQ